MNNYGFYGRQQAAIHHDRFGDLAHDAARVLAGLLVSRGLTAGTVTDLGCGSGILARVMTDLGYDVLGVDISPDMLALAEVNAPRAKFRNESLVDAAIPPSVAVTAIGEALNYATDPRAGLDATTEVAQRVYDALAPGGVFLFDVATPGRHEVEREGDVCAVGALHRLPEPIVLRHDSRRDVRSDPGHLFARE
ncbi:MAG: class I SAM-dependent methyltransferase, partial [Acidimicrobiia bacterium]